LEGIVVAQVVEDQAQAAVISRRQLSKGVDADKNYNFVGGGCWLNGCYVFISLVEEVIHFFMIGFDEWWEKICVRKADS